MFEIAAAASTSNPLTSLIPLLLVFVVLYFFLIRPQNKKQKARNLMLNALRKGDKVVTIGGIHGSIVEITDDIIVLKVNDATKLTFDRSAINAILESAAKE
jgi:preprotein translocase subunit YajC